jgi:hypothetical protein
VAIAIGCRKAGTAPGSWDGAYVIAQQAFDEPMIMAIFTGGSDFIGRPRSMHEAVTNYIVFANSYGFVPMEPGDLALTGGLCIGPETITDVAQFLPTCKTNEKQQRSPLALLAAALTAKPSAIGLATALACALLACFWRPFEIWP